MHGLFMKNARMLAEAEPYVSFVGRLATYRYYNMDQVTAMALHECARLIAPNGSIWNKYRNTRIIGGSNHDTQS